MKKYFLPLLISSAVVLSSCSKDEDKTTPNNTVPTAVACWTVDATQSIDSTHTFTFTSCASNAATTEWDFGDGNFANVSNPTHIYNHFGKYAVRQTVYNTDNVA